jgi:hypothetical protein
VGRDIPTPKGRRFLRLPPSLQRSPSRQGSDGEIAALLSSSLPQHRINPSTHIVRRTGAARLNFAGRPPRENEGVV